MPEQAYLLGLDRMGIDPVVVPPANREQIAQDVGPAPAPGAQVVRIQRAPAAPGRSSSRGLAGVAVPLEAEGAQLLHGLLVELADAPDGARLAALLHSRERFRFAYHSGVCHGRGLPFPAAPPALPARRILVGSSFTST